MNPLDPRDEQYASRSSRTVAMSGTVTVKDVYTFFEWIDQMSEVNFEVGTVSALQTPPPSPTPSVNLDPSAFGTATLHPENRTADPPTRDVQRDATVFFSA